MYIVTFQCDRHIAVNLYKHKTVKLSMKLTKYVYMMGNCSFIASVT